ncbi:MAG: oligosaccharide flippase family protein [Candidatus Woesearchaeota archaeon]
MFKKVWNYGRKDSMIRDSFSLFAATMVVNFGAFLFHLIIARLLGLSSYGVLGVLLAIVYIINVSVNVIQTTITKFVSEFKTNGEEGKINSLVLKSSKKLILYAFVVFVLTILISPMMANFLKMSIMNILLLSPIILFAALLPIVRGMFQGLQKFNLLSLNLYSEIAIKLGLGVLLVYLGMQVNGAILAITLSFLFPIIIAFVPLKKYLKRTKDLLDTKKIYSYSYPVLVAILFLTIMFSIDIILVKHFFEERVAGFYAAVALIGKVIFFATLPISLVMFPKSVEKSTQKKSTTALLKKGVFLVSLVAIPVTLVYFLFPEFTLKLLFGNESISIYNTLGYNIVFLFGIALSLYSFNYLFMIYNLSINRIRFIYPIILLTLAEIVSIYLFHNSLLQVVLILNSVLLLLFAYMIIFTIKSVKWSDCQS